ncbi:hypothetical protein LTS18_000295, partial [Coniosporium uncinatum]
MADGDISSDTDGSVPGTPTHSSVSYLHGGMPDAEDNIPLEQITQCKWEGCLTGDCGNMDKLVDHLHDQHIHARQKKYACEWQDCARKGIPHASGYALRAHMRSHTREKPFYCSLPECDRSFTRSDALAKHMRTVHETEALRPSDPVPKHHSSNPSNKAQRLRLTFGKPAADKSDKSAPASPSVAPSAGPLLDEYDNSNVTFLPSAADDDTYERHFPPDIQFTPEELAMPADQLFRLLRRQLHWATQDADELKAEEDELNKRRKHEWLAKELALENIMEAELAIMETTRDGLGPPDFSDELKDRLLDDVRPSMQLRLTGSANNMQRVWWRDSGKKRAMEQLAYPPESTPME